MKTLVDMVDENYAEHKDLIWMAVDGICRVFEMQVGFSLSYTWVMLTLLRARRHETISAACWLTKAF